MQKTLSDKLQENKRLLHNVIPELKTGNVNLSNIQVLIDLDNFLEDLKIQLTEIKNKF